MIFDRTLSDAKRAVTIREEKVKRGENLTADDIYILSRGFVSVGDLNRIESKQEALKGIFNDMGYYNILTKNAEWTFGDIFNTKDLDRMVENVSLIRKAFFTFSYTPENPKPKYDFENFNRIEKILFDLEDMANKIKSLYVECGNFECGEV